MIESRDTSLAIGFAAVGQFDDQTVCSTRVGRTERPKPYTRTIIGGLINRVWPRISAARSLVGGANDHLDLGNESQSYNPCAIGWHAHRTIGFHLPVCSDSFGPSREPRPCGCPRLGSRIDGSAGVGLVLRDTCLRTAVY
jgi:hypothetical protein